MRPTRYDLHLEADLEMDTFRGRTEILLQVQEPTEQIVLHARDLEFEHVELQREGTTHEPELESDPEQERWRLVFPEAIEAGAARLILTYESHVREDMTGLYRSEAGSQRCLVTQCEPADARSIFPCFDEPDFKAEIAWHITTDEELGVLTNGSREQVRDNGDGTRTHVFQATPPITTYLAAVAIGDFEATDPTEARGVPFRTWALGEGHELGAHARDQAAELLAWYEEYFQHPYPYGKYDQLAVPSFSFGAMENVGLVVYREPLLLVDTKRATWDERKAVDRVVAHEFAHMWFGNLVTMAWWDDLWLNEAFAEWIAHKAVDELEPEHEIWHAFRHRTDQALATDALDSTHAIYHPVTTPGQAMEMFDAITYGKGSAVMRMLEAYLGPEAFQSGLSSYIDAFAEANARGQDLWQHLAQASQQPVAEVMHAWITQPGHPCLEIQLASDDEETSLQQGPAEDESEDTVTIALSQHRHRARRSTTLQKPTWPVPVVVRYADAAGVHETRTLLTKESEHLDIEVNGELAWLVGNAHQGGFYRVDHGEALTQRLITHAPELAPAERWGLIRDSFSLLKAGARTAEEHLALLDSLATPRSHFAFVDDLVGHCRELERLLEAHGDEQALAGLRAWTGQLFAPAFDELGPKPKPGEAPARRHRRASILTALGAIAAEEGAITASTEIAGEERADPDRLDPEAASAAINVAARHGSLERFHTYVETYRRRREADIPPQQVQRYLRALPHFRDEAAITELLTLLQKGQIPNESVGPLLEAMLGEPHAQPATLTYLRERHGQLQERIGLAWIARIVEAVGHVGEPWLEQARSLLEGPAGQAAPESQQRAIERLEQTEELVDAGVVAELAAWARGQQP